MKKALFLLLFSFIFLNLNAQFISEDFENGLPDGWTLDGAWKIGTAAQLKSDYFPFDGNNTKFAGTNDDKAGNNTAADGKLITDFIDFSAEQNVLIQFDLYFYNGNYNGAGQETFEILYSEDGTTWSKITSVKTFYIWSKLYHDLSTAVGGKNVKLAFEYKDGSNWNYGAGVDNIEVVTQPDYFALAFPPAKDYAQIEVRGETKSFIVTTKYYGKEPLSNYKLVYSIDGGSDLEIAGTTTLNSNDTYEFTIPEIELGEHNIIAKVVMNDSMDVNIDDFTVGVYPPVPQFLKNDVYGNEQNLHAELQAGKRVVLDFFASWCGPCESTTPILNSVWETQGSGTKGFQVFGITTESTDTDAKVKGLGWGANYPKFGYTPINRVFWNLFNDKFGQSAIPLFAMICPNIEDPEFSTVSWSQVGGADLKNQLNNAISGCTVQLPVDINFIETEMTINSTIEEDPEFFIELINNGSETGEIFWKLEKPDFNHAWESQVCDNNLCYSRNTDECPSSKPNTMTPGDTSKWSIHLFTHETPDTGLVILKVYSDSDFTNLLTSLPINLSIAGIDATVNFADEKLNISPNPTSDYFQISTTSNVSKVEVFNLIGKKVKSFDTNNSNKFDVSDLRNGVYMIRVFNNDNKVLKVVRLNVQHLRP